MSDSTTNRTETIDDLVEQWRCHGGWRLSTQDGQRLIDEVERLRLAVGAGAVTIDKVASERDVAYDVIRRLRDDWIPMEDHTETMRWRKRSWNPPKWEDMTDAERAVLAAVAGPNDPPVVMCPNGHPFEPGIDIDRPDKPDPRWCNVCGEYSYEVAGPNDTEENRDG